MKKIKELLLIVIYFVLFLIYKVFVKIKKLIIKNKFKILAFFLVVFSIWFWWWTFPKIEEKKEEKAEQERLEVKKNFSLINLSEKYKAKKILYREKTKEVVTHHTAGEKNPNYTDEQAIDAIFRQHTQENGWRTIAYHIMIIDTIAYYLHPLNERIPGVYNMNSSTINVCLMGNFEVRKPTEREIRTLEDVLAWIRECYTIPNFYIHKDFNTTACCGEFLEKAIRPFLQQLNLKSYEYRE